MVITLQNVGLGVYPVKIQWFKYFYSTDLCNPNGRPALVANGVTNGTADLRTGSNDERNTPTGQGLTDRQTLINRGWTIETTD